MSWSKTKHQYKRVLFPGVPPFPGFSAFPGILIFWKKYTDFSLGVAKIALNGSVYCELKICVQVLENFNHREFCGPVNIRLV